MFTDLKLKGSYCKLSRRFCFHGFRN